MRIIVVDDENDALTNFLVSVVDDGRLEYKMFKNDPLTALEYVKRNPADAAFLDINMPGINGVELAERLIKVNAKIRVVFISGYTQDEKAIRNRLGENLYGFCYKPYSKDQLFAYIKKIADAIGDGRQINIMTFGAFDIFIDNRPITFSAAKSKELLALLTHKNGAFLTLNEAISFLWPDKNAEQAKKSFSDARWRLQHTLSEFGLENLVTFSRAQQAINKTGASCDYWDFLDGKNREQYKGVYMPNYDWSIETQSALDIMKEKL